MTDDSGVTASGRPVSERLSADQVRALYDQHARDLLLYLTGILRDGESAQDACQATFQRLLESGQDARVETIRGWLFKVGFHEAMAIRRKETRHSRRQRELEVEQLVDGQSIGLPLQSLVQDEDVSRLKRLLKDLPAEQQFVIHQRIQENKTFAVIAEELQVPIGTVLTRMRLAIQKLQKWFE